MIFIKFGKLPPLQGAFVLIIVLIILFVTDRRSLAPLLHPSAVAAVNTSTHGVKEETLHAAVTPVSQCLCL